MTRTLQLDRLDEGHGIEAAMVLNNGHWHKPCATALQRAQNRPVASGSTIADDVPGKQTWSFSSSVESSSSRQLPASSVDRLVLVLIPCMR